MKTCTRCGETKPLDGFYVDRRAKSGRTSQCKPCMRAARKNHNVDVERRRAREREWNATNRERRRDIDRRYYRRNKEASADRARRWRAQNREHIAIKWKAYYEANREHLLKERAAWLKNHPDKKRAARKPELMRRDRERRRARLLNAFVADVDYDEILQRDLGVCGVCGEQIVGENPELDHIIPLAADGTHEPNNVQLAHLVCNRRKATRTAA